MAGEDVEVKFGANISGAVDGIESVGHKLKDLDGPVREVIESFGQLRKTFIEAFAVREIAEFVTRIADLGEQAVRNATMLGMSVESVQKLGFAAKMTGGDAEGMAMGLMRLERNMAEAQDGSSKAAKAFEALGISQADLKNKSPEQVLGLIADAFHNAKDGADKTAIAMDLMGRSGAQMIPIFDQGSEGLKKMGVIAEQTGSILTSMEAEGLEGTAQGITTLKASVEGVGISLLEVFKPAVDALITGLTALVQTLRAVVEMIRVLVDLIEDGIATAIAGVIAKFEEFGVSASTAIGNIKTGFVTLGTVIDDVIHGHFDKAADDWVEGTYRIQQANATAAASIAKIGKEYDDLALKIQKATLAALTFGTPAAEGGKTQLHAPTTGKADDGEEKDEIAIEKSDLATKLELYKLDEAAKKASDQIKVDSGQISNAQMLADLKKSLEGEKEASLKEINEEQALYDSDSVAWEQLQNKKLIVTKQYDNQIQQIALKSAAEQKKAYDQLFKSIQSAFDQMVNGILQGTQTWHQAMVKLFDNLAIKFVDDFVVKAVLKWAQGEAEQLAATQAKNDAIVSSNTAAGAASDAAGASHLIKEIESSAAATYAGVFAFLSPELGPAAAIPAGVSAAAVGAMTGLVSLDVGAWNVPQNMPAYLHAGEMVVPQNFASGLRDGGGIGGGGGGDAYQITMNINALDGANVANVLQSSAGQKVIINSVNQAVRNMNPKVMSAMR